MAMAQEITLPSTGVSPDLSTGSIFFIGTATVLIRYAEFAILTDPNFIHKHEQVDLGYGLSATRQTDPAMEIHELPPLDLVLLSHFHGDHCRRNESSLCLYRTQSRYGPYRSPMPGRWSRSRWMIGARRQQEFSGAIQSAP
jgi:glyoxylase-like metal-dependent hydrolase (beta-lactamase superfamily II)